MNSLLRSASGAALLIGMAHFAPALAQEAPAAQQPAVDRIAPQQQTDAPSTDRVVITGQLIAGASVDAPSPVEVYTLKDLVDQGAPTAAEFLRSLSITSEAQGEADSQIAGAVAGIATVNLRGLGNARTLVLMNGNKFGSSATADINTIPSMAIGRIDVLKDGAAVTYGAGAVGGVINYITRSDFDGFELNVEKKLFDGSDGEDNFEALWGVQSDNAGFILGASYGKRHALQANQRSFAQLPYTQQPTNYVLFSSNPSQYFTTTPGTGTPTSTMIRDYTVDSCRAIGGERSANVNSNSANPDDCSYPVYDQYNLVEEEEYLRAYGEFNADFSDTMKFHAEVAYAKTVTPNIWTLNSYPSGGNVAQIQSGVGGGFSIPYLSPTYNAAGQATANCVTTPAACAMNPFVEEFYNRAVATGAYSATGPRTDLDTVAASRWWPLSFGGNALYPENGGRHSDRQERERFGGALSMSGDFIKEGLFGQFLPEGTTYSYTAYYNQYANVVSRPDWVVSRLQNALNGYGGAGCKALDRVPTNYTSAQTYDTTVGIQSDIAPGTNGCEYFNPFASSFGTSFVNGAANPAYGGSSFENSVAMLDWLEHDRVYETINSALTFNATFTGIVPGVSLPGGDIGWAAGTEWRQTETRGRPEGTQEEIAIAGQRCPWNDDMALPATTPGVNACYADRGAFFGPGLSSQRPYSADRQVMSYYGELQLPVLDNLNVQLAARREEFETVAGNIWKIAAKYDVNPTLSFRGSLSTNFQAPPESLGAEGDVRGTTYIASLFRSIGTTTRVSSGITPEKDRAANIGVIWQPELYGGYLRTSLDLWEIIIDKEVGDTDVATVLSSVFRNPTTGAATGNPATTSVVNCSGRFISLLTFTEPCNDTAPITSAARTTGADLDTIFRYTLNTGGFITSGLDFNIDYTRAFGPGDISVGGSGSNVMSYKIKGYNLPDGTFYRGDFDGLAWANLTRGGTMMPRWRANTYVGYAWGDHRARLRANYISGFRDDTGTPLGSAQTTIVGLVNGVPQYPTYGTTPSDYVDFDFNYVYTAPYWQDLQFRLSVLNLTDEDPMPAQHTNAFVLGASANRGGYYPGYGNPRGRQIEIGITKTF